MVRPKHSKSALYLDLERPFDIDQVRALFASADDSTDSQLRVTEDGIAFISSKIASDDTAGFALRLESFMAGNGYVGLKASEDDRWMKEMLNVLKKNWPNPTAEYLDHW